MAQSSIVVLIAAMMLAAAALPAHAAPGGNGKGNGNAYGKGWYRNNGGAGGAPLPALGATLIGQLVALGGIAMLWRRRRKYAASAQPAGNQANA